MARGLSHRTTVLALYGVSIVLAGVAVALSHSEAEQTLAFVGAIAAIAAIRKNNLSMRSAVRQAGELLRHAGEPDAVWQVVQETVPALEASCAALRLVVRNGTVRTSEYSWGFDDAPLDVPRARFSVLGERPDDGGLELGFTDSRRTVDRDTEISIELLREHVHAAAQRMNARHEAEATGSRKLLAFRRYWTFSSRAALMLVTPPQ